MGAFLAGIALSMFAVGTLSANPVLWGFSVVLFALAMMCD